MSPSLSREQLEALAARNGNPIEVIHPRTHKVYIIIERDQLEHGQPIFDDAEYDVRALYPLIAKTAAAAGWADPAMDAYDHYDEIHPTR